MIAETLRMRMGAHKCEHRQTYRETVCGMKKPAGYAGVSFAVLRCRTRQPGPAPCVAVYTA